MLLEELKPATIADFAVNREFIHVAVWEDSTVYLTRIKILSDYDERGKFRVHVTHDDGSYEDDVFTEGRGIPHQERKYIDNFHRLIPYTLENYEFLRDMFEDGLTIEWLQHIGINDSVGEFLKLRLSKGSVLSTFYDDDYDECCHCYHCENLDQDDDEMDDIE